MRDGGELERVMAPNPAMGLGAIKWSTACGGMEGLAGDVLRAEGPD